MDAITNEIREIVPEDCDEIQKLWNNTPGMGLSRADTKQNIEKFLERNKGLSFCCLKDGRIIGTVLCGHDGRRGYIYHVAVAVEYRGRSIGTKLVEKSLIKLKDEGIDKCHLFVFADNDIGNAFWSSTGWIIRNDIIVYSKNI